MVIVGRLLASPLLVCPLLVCPLGGCVAAGTAAAVDVAAVTVIHRDIFDAIWSTVTGRDCSVVRLDEGRTYCRPIQPPPRPVPYCTRSLGSVDCWQDPQALPHPIPPQVADGPMTLTPAQDADRTRRWPPL